MAGWEEEKRKAQMEFISPQSDMEAAHASVDSFYRQILTSGYVTPALSNDSLTQQILDGDFREPDIKKADLDRVYEQNHDRDWNVEPER